MKTRTIASYKMIAQLIWLRLQLRVVQLAVEVAARPYAGGGLDAAERSRYWVCVVVDEDNDVVVDRAGRRSVRNVAVVSRNLRVLESLLVVSWVIQIYHHNLLCAGGCPWKTGCAN